MKTLVIIGGGTGGIMTAAQALKKSNFKITLIEPSHTHHYQPAWTLVGANTYNYAKTFKPMKDVIPKGVNWIKEYVRVVDPKKNSLTLASGTKLSYDFLVVSAGIKIANNLVEGLSQAIDKGVVCSNYTNPQHTWQVLKNFKGGVALFTLPNTPIKCGGAPQKIMYLAEEYFKKKGLRNNTTIVFATNGGVIFGVKPIKETLMSVIDKKNINIKFGHQLVKVDGEKQIAWYKLSENQSEHNPKGIELLKEGDLVGIKYDMMHLAPPQAAPDFIKESELSNKDGWLDINKETLQHQSYSNIFGIGDCTSVPTAKTGAAIRKQVPVVVENISGLSKNLELSTNKYNGYSSCPLVTSYGKMVLAEFDYENNFTPDPKLKLMFIKDSSKEHRRLWLLKKYILPKLYWNKMLKGKEV